MKKPIFLLIFSSMISANGLAASVCTLEDYYKEGTGAGAEIVDVFCDGQYKAMQNKGANKETATLKTLVGRGYKIVSSIHFGATGTKTILVK